MEHKQYGVVPYQRRGKKVDVYLITRRQSGLWGVPKGWDEPDMSRKAVARMEAFEEAGLKGKLDTKVSYGYPVRRKGKDAMLELFAMEVTESLERWPEDHQRSRTRVSLAKAIKMVACPDLKDCLSQFQRQLS